MTPKEEAAPVLIRDGEKLSNVMIYTKNLFAWGQVVTVEAIRVSTWLRTQAKPTYIILHNAQLLDISGGKPSKPQAFKELHLPTAQVIGYHLKPPEHDPLDYDPNEENRVMAPVTVLVGTFRFSGKVRMSAQTNLGRFLDVSKLEFTALYEVSIKQTVIPTMGIFHVPYALVRSEGVLFSPT